jgi:hypothetical protein
VVRDLVAEAAAAHFDIYDLVADSDFVQDFPVHRLRLCPSRPTSGAWHAAALAYGLRAACRRRRSLAQCDENAETDFLLQELGWQPKKEENELQHEYEGARGPKGSCDALGSGDKGASDSCEVVGMSVGQEGLENLSGEAGDPHGYDYIRQDFLVNIKGVAGDLCEVPGDDDETEEPCDYIEEHEDFEDLIVASDSCEVTGKAMKGQCDGCNIGDVEVPHSPWGGTEYIKEPKMQASLTPAKAKGKRPKPKKTRPGGPQHFESGVKTVTAEAAKQGKIGRWSALAEDTDEDDSEEAEGEVEEVCDRDDDGLDLQKKEEKLGAEVASDSVDRGYELQFQRVVFERIQAVRADRSLSRSQRRVAEAELWGFWQAVPSWGPKRSVVGSSAVDGWHAAVIARRGEGC